MLRITDCYNKISGWLQIKYFVHVDFAFGATKSEAFLGRFQAVGESGGPWKLKLRS
jgi:hypothetical protein